MEIIKDVVKDVVRALERKNSASSKEDVESLLKKVLNKKELGHIKFNYFRNNKLSIKVDSSTWLYYLNLRKEDLLIKLGTVSNKVQVKDIHFYLGEVG